MFYLPLMNDNIDKSDVKSVIDFLSQDSIPKLTNGPKVVEFEKAWGYWLGTQYNLFVNSGASANELTMLALAHIIGEGEIIVPPLTWISDISSVLFAGHKLVFVDVNLTNLSFDIDKLKAAITPNTKAVFLTHVLGINGITEDLLEICEKNNILLIEDVCESHGTTSVEGLNPLVSQALLEMNFRPFRLLARELKNVLAVKLLSTLPQTTRKLMLLG